MKPYILSYSDTIAIKDSGLVFDEESQTNRLLSSDIAHQTFTTKGSNDDSIRITDRTTITETIESVDEDSIVLGQSTLEACVVESSDLDMRLSSSTVITRTVEPSDEDKIYQAYGSTFITKTIEQSDDDELF